MTEADSKTGGVLYFEPLCVELNDCFGSLKNITPDSVFSARKGLLEKSKTSEADEDTDDADKSDKKNKQSKSNMKLSIIYLYVHKCNMVKTLKNVTSLKIYYFLSRLSACCSGIETPIR